MLLIVLFLLLGLASAQGTVPHRRLVTHAQSLMGQVENMAVPYANQVNTKQCKITATNEWGHTGNSLGSFLSVNECLDEVLKNDDCNHDFFVCSQNVGCFCFEPKLDRSQCEWEDTEFSTYAIGKINYKVSMVKNQQCKIGEGENWGHTNAQFGDDTNTDITSELDCLTIISKESSCNKNMFIFNKDTNGCYCFADQSATTTDCTSYESTGYRTYEVISVSTVGVGNAGNTRSNPTKRCEKDEDCGKAGWCAQMVDRATKTCVKYVSEGGSCNSNLPIDHHERCADGLKCVYPTDVKGASGKCIPVASKPVILTNLSSYPGQSKTYKGLIQLTFSGTSVIIQHKMMTADPTCATKGPNYALSANSCGMHIHAGKSCDSKSKVGGHYYSTAADPWYDASYFSMTGIMSVDYGYNFEESVGHVFVIHDVNGDRITCNVIAAAGCKCGSQWQFDDGSCGVCPGTAAVAQEALSNGQLCKLCMLASKPENKPQVHFAKDQQCKIGDDWGHTNKNFKDDSNTKMLKDEMDCWAVIFKDSSCNKNMFVFHPDTKGCYCFADLTLNTDDCSYESTGYSTYVVHHVGDENDVQQEEIYAASISI